MIQSIQDVLTSSAVDHFFGRDVELEQLLAELDLPSDLDADKSATQKKAKDEKKKPVRRPLPTDLERIEKIKRTDVENLGGKRVIKYRGGSLPLFSIDEVAMVNPLADTVLHADDTLLVEGSRADMLRLEVNEQTPDGVVLADELSEAEVLAAMEEEEREEVADLLQYPPETAGGLMGKEFATCTARQSAGEAVAVLRGLEGVWAQGEQYDLAGFVRLADEMGLKVILKPGPFIGGQVDLGIPGEALQTVIVGPPR